MILGTTFLLASLVVLICLVGVYIFFKADVERLRCANCGKPLKANGHAIFDFDRCNIICQDCWEIEP
jgi:hypothetical protein